MFKFIKKLFEKQYIVVFIVYNDLGELIFRDFITGTGKFTNDVITKLEDEYLDRINSNCSLKYPYEFAQVINIIKV